MTSLSTAYGTETRGYNVLGQLTSIGAPAVSMTYNYPGANNGRISSAVIAGESISYQYDALNRLVSATGAGWSESYTYDRYGNLGSIGGQSIGVDPGTNRLISGFYDANGNYNAANGWGYDVENRLIQANGQSQGTQYYGYDSGNKRVWKRFLYNGSIWTEHVFYYGAQGRLGTYEPQWQGSTLRLVRREQAYYFVGRLLKTNSGWLTMDRLGSVVDRSDQGPARFRPYGQEYSSNSPNDQQKFATYYRDNDMALDYADQRYYQAGVGRFVTPDPYLRGPQVVDTGTWNLYGYTSGDPVTYLDPTGENMAREGDDREGPGGGGGADGNPCAVLGLIPVPRVLCYLAPGIALAQNVRPRRPRCTEVVGTPTGDYQTVILRILNENSFGYLGQRAYDEDETIRDTPSGPVITMQSIFQEDLMIASVLWNRANDPRYRTGGTTMASQALAAAGRGFPTWGRGPALFFQGLNAEIGTPLCENLMSAALAAAMVMSTGPTNSQILNWRGYVQGSPLFVARTPPGGFRINRSVFW